MSEGHTDLNNDNDQNFYNGNDNSNNDDDNNDIYNNGKYHYSSELGQIIRISNILKHELTEYPKTRNALLYETKVSQK